MEIVLSGDSHNDFNVETDKDGKELNTVDIEVERDTRNMRGEVDLLQDGQKGNFEEEDEDEGDEVNVTESESTLLAGDPQQQAVDIESKLDTISLADTIRGREYSISPSRLEVIRGADILQDLTEMSNYADRIDSILDTQSGRGSSVSAASSRSRHQSPRPVISSSSGLQLENKVTREEEEEEGEHEEEEVEAEEEIEPNSEVD